MVELAPRSPLALRRSQLGSRSASYNSPRIQRRCCCVELLTYAALKAAHVESTHQNIKRAHDAMILRRKMRGTTIAFSPCHNSSRKNTTARTPKPTRVPMTSASPHDRETPPNSSARKRHIKDPSRQMMPGKSKFSNSSPKDTCCGPACDGKCKKSRRSAAQTPPMGRLIKKLL